VSLETVDFDDSHTIWPGEIWIRVVTVGQGYPELLNRRGDRGGSDELTKVDLSEAPTLVPVHDAEDPPQAASAANAPATPLSDVGIQRLDRRQPSSDGGDHHPFQPYVTEHGGEIEARPLDSG
jgi:hypothetical protein